MSKLLTVADAAKLDVNRVDDAFLQQLQGNSLVTAEILYHMPDYPAFLQTFVWQHYDLAPKFPEFRRFLDFWRRELDGALHSVKFAHQALVGTAELRIARAQFILN